MDGGFLGLRVSFQFLQPLEANALVTGCNGPGICRNAAGCELVAVTERSGRPDRVSQ